jgi:hypothetical protein
MHALELPPSFMNRPPAKYQIVTEKQLASGSYTVVKQLASGLLLVLNPLWVKWNEERKAVESPSRILWRRAS